MKYSTLLTVKKNILNSCGTNIMEKYGTVITDSIIRIGNHIYHLECQSSKDKTMVIRMFEYDISIAIEHASYENDEIWEIEFPQSCVLYIRNHRDLPDYHEAVVKFADGQKCATVFQFYRQKSIPLTAFLRNGY